MQGEGNICFTPHHGESEGGEHTSYDPHRGKYPQERRKQLEQQPREPIPHVNDEYLAQVQG
jgi:hypothetical protein